MSVTARRAKRLSVYRRLHIRRQTRDDFWRAYHRMHDAITGERRYYDGRHGQTQYTPRPPRLRPPLTCAARAISQKSCRFIYEDLIVGLEYQCARARWFMMLRDEPGYRRRREFIKFWLPGHADASRQHTRRCQRSIINGRRNNGHALFSIFIAGQQRRCQLEASWPKRCHYHFRILPAATSCNTA